MDRLRVVFFVVGIALAPLLKAQMPDKTSKPARTNADIHARSLGLPASQPLSINNISAWYNAKGFGTNPMGNPVTGFPRGTDNVVYSEALVWGARAYLDASRTIPNASQPVLIGGGTYSGGTQGGAIVGGFPETPSNADVRVYRIRRDYRALSDQELTREAALVFYIPENSVTSVERSAVLDQYDVDWTNWPAAKGAPYVERNGVPGYQAPPPFNFFPTAGPLFTSESLITQHYDEPGVTGANTNAVADQVVWTVYNDATSVNFVGSNPMKMEVQKTAWAYKSDGPLGNVTFVRYRFINKGTYWLDSMFVAQWSDPDIGEAQNDIIGCDSTLSLGFAYNGTPVDLNYSRYSLAPPAVGYDFFAGPIVPSVGGDSAVFGLQRRYGFRNLGMSSFSYFSGGSQYSDPPSGNYPTGSGRWWQLLRGYAPMASDFSSQDFFYPSGPFPTSKFPFSGDPVTGQGWLDGLGMDYSVAPGDRRIIMASGPFRMAPGDTQEVVVGFVAGIGADRLSSVAAMRGNDRFAQFMYDRLFSINPPNITYTMSYPGAGQVSLAFLGTGGTPKVQSIQLALRDPAGILIGTVALVDDGLHNDGGSGDGVFGGGITLTRRLAPLSADLSFTDIMGNTHEFTKNLPCIVVAGEFTIGEPTLFSDNLNSDGVPNPGEEIRIGLSVTNATPFVIPHVTLWVSGEKYDNGRMIGDLGAGQTHTMVYDPSNPQSYFSLDIPSQWPDSTMNISVEVRDSLGNSWRQLLAVPVRRPSRHFYGTTIARTAGIGSSDFNVLIVDRSALRPDQYVVSIVESLGVAGLYRFTLTNTTTGTTLLHRHEMPDAYGHNIPVTEGFKVLRGQNWDGARVDTQWVFTNPRWVTGGVRFSGSRSLGATNSVIPGSEFPNTLYSEIQPGPTVRPTSIEIRFNAAAGQLAYRLVRTSTPWGAVGFRLDTTVVTAVPGGEPYAQVPFQVWDVSIPASPRQLMVAWRDLSANGTWDATSISEFILIYGQTYDPSMRRFQYLGNPVRTGTVIWNEPTQGALADIAYGASLVTISGFTPNSSTGVLRIMYGPAWDVTDRFGFKSTYAPETPELTYPTNNTTLTNHSMTTQLFWSEVGSADRYRVQIARDSFFTTIAFDDSTFATPSTLDSMWYPLPGYGPAYVYRNLRLQYNTQYYWRVAGINPYGTGSWSSTWNFTTDRRGVPTTWTGRNVSRSFPMYANFSSSYAYSYAIYFPGGGSRQLISDDAVGFFFWRNDSLVNAGFYYYGTGDFYAFVWGDDPTTPDRDGLSMNEEPVVMVWDAIAEREYFAYAGVSTGGALRYTGSSTTALVTQLSTTPYLVHGMHIQTGWNMLSSFVQPAQGMFPNIYPGEDTSIVLVKDGLGRVYWPALGVNTIGEWDFRNGYQVYASRPDTLGIFGLSVDPATTPITLPAGWNLVSYLRRSPMRVDSALISIQPHLVLAKNNAGQVYWPSEGVMVLEALRPGQGYQLYIRNDATLTYPADSGYARPIMITRSVGAPAVALAKHPEKLRLEAPHYVLAREMTGSNAVLLVESSHFKQGDEVAVISATGLVVGTAVASGPKVLLTLWGDDPMTVGTDGSLEGEGIRLVLWSPARKREHALEVRSVVDAISGREQAGMSFASNSVLKARVSVVDAIPTEFGLSQNYPNPFNPATTILYQLPKDVHVHLAVYDMLGQRVATLVDGPQKAGYQQVVWEASNLSSGVYFYRLTAGEFKSVRKMQLVK